jgi:N4-gp56 family major capsid protein
MAIQTTTNLSNASRIMYAADYLRGAQMMRLYDQLAAPVSEQGVESSARMGTSVRVNFLSDMTPGTTTISQTSDVVPQTLVDAYADITPTSRWGALQWAEALDVYAYTDYGKARFELLGKHQMETIDVLARDAATQGSAVQRAVARASLDAGTTGHRLTDGEFAKAEIHLQLLKVPAFVENGRPQWFAIMPPDIFYDLRTSTNVLAVGTYQDKEIVLNFELGQIGPFKLIVTPYAKAFYGQGAANGTAYSSTLSSAASPLDKTIVVGSTLASVAGRWLNIIDTAETANTHVATNERVKYVSGTTTGTIIGEGSNGGLRFEHAAGAAVTNADSVYTCLFGGPKSLAKLYDAVTGEYGKVIGPKMDGVLDQFASIGWKYYGGYGRWVESWLLRGEYASSLDA